MEGQKQIEPDGSCAGRHILGMHTGILRCSHLVVDTPGMDSQLGDADFVGIHGHDVVIQRESAHEIRRLLCTL